MTHVSDLLGFLVVARAEGEQLGTLSAIYVDPDTKRLAALGYRTRRVAGEHFFVPIDAVENVGKDVVIISSRGAVKEVTEATQPPGRSLRDLQGSRVTTMAGAFLGVLVDLDFSEDWRISELTLEDDRHLIADAEQLRIGDDILVPTDYTERPAQPKESSPGFLGRVFGSEALDDTKQALRRALRRDDEGKT